MTLFTLEIIFELLVDLYMSLSKCCSWMSEIFSLKMGEGLSRIYFSYVCCLFEAHNCSHPSLFLWILIFVRWCWITQEFGKGCSCPQWIHWGSSSTRIHGHSSRCFLLDFPCLLFLGISFWSLTTLSFSSQKVPWLLGPWQQSSTFSWANWTKFPSNALSGPHYPWESTQIPHTETWYHSSTFQSAQLL